jgi:hypothetical protein
MAEPAVKVVQQQLSGPSWRYVFCIFCPGVIESVQVETTILLIKPGFIFLKVELTSRWASSVCGAVETREVGPAAAGHCCLLTFGPPLPLIPLAPDVRISEVVFGTFWMCSIQSTHSASHTSPNRSAGNEVDVGSTCKASEPALSEAHEAGLRRGSCARPGLEYDFSSDDLDLTCPPPPQLLCTQATQATLSY